MELHSRGDDEDYLERNLPLELPRINVTCYFCNYIFGRGGVCRDKYFQFDHSKSTVTSIVDML